MERTPKSRWLYWSLLLSLIALFTLGVKLPMAAANSLRLAIDGKLVTDPPPQIHQGRTMVPIRLIAENLGAEVDWVESQKAVHIMKGNRSVVMRIDSHLVETDTGIKSYSVSDVPPMLLAGRTYVPLRMVGNALGVAVSWEESTNTVHVNSKEAAAISPFFNLEMTSVKPRQVVNGKMDLKLDIRQSLPPDAKEVRYLLLSPDTGRGFIIARGTNLSGTYSWLPDMESQGPRVLVAAIYNSGGRFIAGEAIPIEVNLAPDVALTGLTPGQVVQGSVTLSSQVNFTAASVAYEFTNVTTGKTFITPKSDPLGTYNWSPVLEDNGVVSVRVIAYSAVGTAYNGEAVAVNVNATKRVELRGVSAGATIEKPVNISVNANFAVAGIEYVLRDPASKQEQTLAWVETAAHRFFPSSSQAGAKELFARVKDTNGVVHTTAAISVNVSGKPLLLMTGIGPSQVVTAPVNLTVSCNVPLELVRYILTDTTSGERRELGSAQPNAQYNFSPSREGNWSIRAEGVTLTGTTLFSETVSFRVYLGTIYGARPIIARDQFLPLASNLAVASWQQTGMSAALQTAQAILETGWGQSVPVDKYTGLFSNNLFGIKGTGPAGSVISNTWEEYNGVAFRVDANFRAYASLEQGWDDHKNLLLVAQRYQPLRDVMYDSTLGAWALRRAGYATDSQYPIKLIDIINRYNLRQLDEVGF